ncbi:hypothetical protein IAU60_000431 [Kwoniella sp. DSM 27419]
MALRLRQAIPGRPHTTSACPLGTITVGDKGYVVYPSASNVVVLSPSLQLSHTLQFWSALPHRASTSKPGNVQGVCCDGPDALILAWSEVHVVIWQPVAAKGQTSWTVHSTVVASSSITCLNYRAGILVLGTSNGIEYWRTDAKAEVVVWDRIWERQYPAPWSVCLSPASGHLSWFRQGEKSVHILATDRGGQATGMAQELRHPRQISWIGWRRPSARSSDTHLYTITSNSVFRVYSPVLDDPLWFQLQSSLDHRAFSRLSGDSSASTAKGKEPEHNTFGSIWAWDAQMVRLALKAEQEKAQVVDGELQPTQSLQLLEAEESDVIVWSGPDNEVVLRSVVNMERAPPTLLRTLPLARLKLPKTSSPTIWSPHSQLVHVPGQEASLIAVTAPTDASPTIKSYNVSLTDLLASKPTGVKRHAPAPVIEETVTIQLKDTIDRFVRTPNGRGLLALGEEGEIATWFKQQLSLRPAKWAKGPRSLIGKGHWRSHLLPTQAAIFAKGRAIVFCHVDDQGVSTVTLQHLDQNATSPREPVTLPHFAPSKGDAVEMLLAVSDIDDGYNNMGRKTQRAIIMAATTSGEAWVWRVMSKITPEEDQVSSQPNVTLLSHSRLPVDSTHPDAAPWMILPVDPMGWHQSVIDWATDTPLQDMVLTISDDGDLEFWTPKIGTHLAGEAIQTLRLSDAACNGDALHTDDGGTHPWTRTGVVKTGRNKVVKARCSSRKKTALVCELPDGRHEMTIWDSKVSEFSTGLELTHAFEQGEAVLDLDWTTTSDLQSVLAVGFAHKIVLLCEQRMSYAEYTPGWAPFLDIDMTQYTGLPISDSIWLAGGSLAVGAGNQIYLFSRFLGRESPEASPSGSMRSVQLDDDEAEDIFQLIAHRNGPLVDYHPVQLGQCLLWNKIDLVKSILLQLDKALRESEEEGKKRLRYDRLDPSEFYARKRPAKSHKSAVNRYDGLFDTVPVPVEEQDDEFSDRAVTDLINRLNGPIAMPLSVSEKSFLATVIQATLEAEEQRRSLDLCGMRYLLSLQMYVNWNRLSTTSGAMTPMNGDPMRSSGVDDIDGHLNSTGRRRGRQHFSFRNVVWATHSDSHDLLLSASTNTCRNGKMLWEDASRMGVFLWLKPGEAYKAQLENVARNRFMADEDRDPSKCSLIFFALGKKKVVHGLWRQAPGHKEQALMLKFLANDFELDRWKTAALKNAYALLSKQRYEYAAAFFMLAGQPKDAITVCLRQLKDWQLGVALARAIEPAESNVAGPLLKWVLEDTVLPIAFQGGHRWLATWAFWTLGWRDLAVRILISPMTDIALVFSPDNSLEVGNPDNDDPSLLLMFQHLKTKSLQTAKGTSEVSAKLEFDFVLHNARVFFRMGCHNLALDLLRSWSFERPFFPSRIKTVRSSSTAPRTPASGAADGGAASMLPVRPSINGTDGMSRSFGAHGHKRRPSFMLTSGGRRESHFMDIDVLAESNDSSALPSPSAADRSDPFAYADASRASGAENVNGHGDGPGPAAPVPEKPPTPSTPPRKIGNLMKELKQDVQQGGMEFNMDNFF